MLMYTHYYFGIHSGVWVCLTGRIKSIDANNNNDIGGNDEDDDDDDDAAAADDDEDDGGDDENGVWINYNDISYRFFLAKANQR